jgi:large conductance mechanosensitive channel
LIATPLGGKQRASRPAFANTGSPDITKMRQESLPIRETAATPAAEEAEMLKEFQTFIARGNVMDMAVGIIMGAAFTAIVTSLVDDLVSPLIGLFIGGIDFSGLSVGIGNAQFMYGNFINAVIKFIIIAWVVFLLVKGVNRIKDLGMKKEEPAPETPKRPTQEELLAEIRDAIKAQGS